MDELRAHLDPELGDVLLAGLERGEDLLDLVQALGRVAVAHLSADGAGRAREDPLAFRVEPHAVVLVDVGDVEGQRAEEQVELAERERAGGQRQQHLAAVAGGLGSRRRAATGASPAGPSIHA